MKKGTEKTSDIDLRRGPRVPSASLRKGVIYFFHLVITGNQKNVSRL